MNSLCQPDLGTLATRLNRTVGWLVCTSTTVSRQLDGGGPEWVRSMREHMLADCSDARRSRTSELRPSAGRHPMWRRRSGSFVRSRHSTPTSYHRLVRISSSCFLRNIFRHQQNGVLLSSARELVKLAGNSRIKAIYS